MDATTTTNRRDRRRTELDWSGRHGTVMGTINAAGGALSASMIGDLAGVNPAWAAAAGGLGALGSLAAGRAQQLTRASLAYRMACWAAGGAWAADAIASSPWSLNSLSALAAGAIGAGVLAPAFARHERRERDARRRVLLATQRARLAQEWETRIDRVCQIRGARVVGIEQWDGDTGFTLDVELPSGGVTWKTIAAAQDGLASDARLPEGCGVEVTQGVNRGTCLARVSTVNALLTEYPFPTDYSPTTINNPFPVGVFRDGTLTEAEFRWVCGLLIGQTGSGKTNMLQVINGQLVRCVDTIVWHIDLAGGGIALPWITPWHEGRADAPAVDWVATNADEAEKMASAGLEIIGIRKAAYKQRMREANDDKLPVGPDVPQIVIVADEFAELPMRVQNILESMSNTGRAAGVRVLNCALRGTADIVSTNMRKQAGLRIGMRVQDSEELAYLFGWDGKAPNVEDAPYEGCGFIKQGQTPARAFKSFRLTPAAIENIACAVGDRRPALDDLSAQGPIVSTVYPGRWDRAAHLFQHTTITPATEQPTTPVIDAPGTVNDALRDVDTARRNLRRAVAGRDGHDADLDNEFRGIVEDAFGVSMNATDPATWTRHEQLTPRVPTLLSDAHTITAATDGGRIHVADLAAALAELNPAAYANTDPKVLGATLAAHLAEVGVERPNNGQLKIGGVNRQGFRADDLADAIRRFNER